MTGTGDDELNILISEVFGMPFIIKFLLAYRLNEKGRMKLLSRTKYLQLIVMPLQLYQYKLHFGENPLQSPQKTHESIFCGHEN